MSMERAEMYSYVPFLATSPYLLILNARHVQFAEAFNFHSTSIYFSHTYITDVHLNVNKTLQKSHLDVTVLQLYHDLFVCLFDALSVPRSIGVLQSNRAQKSPINLTPVSTTTPQ